MSAFGLQNQPITATPTGRIDSQFLNGADGSNIVPAWDLSGLASLQTLQVGTGFSVDLAVGGFLTDPGSPASELGFHDVSGQKARDAGWVFTGTVLSNANIVATFGAFQMVALRNGIAVLSPMVSFSISAPAGVDSISPTVPTGIVATPGVTVGTIALAFDSPCDIAQGSTPASGGAHVDVLVNGVVASPPSPITIAANALSGPVAVNLGSITSPSAPTFNQNGKVWTQTAAGTGIATTSTEQCQLVDFGVFNGAQKFIAKIDAYTESGAATALMGLMLHETAVVGGKFLGVGLRPSNGTVGLIVETRATASTNSAQQLALTVDQNGLPLVGPVYVKIQRAADLKTLTISYSTSGNAWIVISTQSITMGTGVHYCLFMTSQTAGVQVTGNIEEVAVSNTAVINTVITSAVAVALQLRSVDVAGNVSALSAAVNGVPSQKANNKQTIKFAPGWIMELDNGSGGGGLAGWLSQIAASASEPNITAVCYRDFWTKFEDPAGGTYAVGFNVVDQLLAACVLARKKFMVAFFPGAFGTTVRTNASGILPNYFETLTCSDGLTPGYAKWPGGTHWAGDLVLSPLLWDSVVMGKFIAMTQAYAARYESNPAFLCFHGPGETSIGVPVSTRGYTATTLTNQLIAWMIAARTAFPTTSLRIETNFMVSNDATQSQRLLDQAFVSRIMCGGPDVKVNSGVTLNEMFAGVAGGTKDYRNLNGFCSEIQTPDFNAFTPTTAMAKIFAWAESGSLAQGGSMISHYYMIWRNTWSGDNGNYPLWSPNILPFVHANPVTHLTYPTSWN